MKRQSPRTMTLLGSLVCFLALGFSDTAQGQTLTVDKQEVDFTLPTNGTSSQVVNVSTDISTTAFVNVSGAPVWLTGPQTGPVNVLVGNPTPLNVVVNVPNGFAQGTYQYIFTVGVQNSQTPPIPITVKLTVSGASQLSANPTALIFAAQVGTLQQNIPTQSVTITSSGPVLNYTVSASTTDGHSWLIPFTTTGVTGGTPITVGVNPAGLTANTYQGSILVQSTTTNDSVAIGVTFTVTPNATLAVTPSILQPFLYQIGTTQPPTQTLTVSSSGGSVNFTVTMNPPATWLVINPTSGATGITGQGVPVTFSVNTGGLGPGVYNTAVTIGVLGGSSLPAIQAQLIVSNNPLLKLSNNVLNFIAQFSSTQGPPDQSVMVTTTGTGAAVPFSVTSDSPWLTVTPTSGTTPTTLTIHVDPSRLLVGGYTGTLTVRPGNGDLYSLPITVNLTVTNAAVLTAGPAQLLFSFQANQTPPGAQLVQIQSTGQPITFTIGTSVTMATNCPTNWLTATSITNTTPATLQVGITTGGMTVGVCSGTVTLTYNSGAGPTSVSIPVTVDVSASAELSIALPLGFGVYSAPQNGSNIVQLINLTSTDPNTQVSFQATANNTGPAPWLFASASNCTLGNCTTPNTLVIQIVPGTLPVGSYTGTLSIVSSSLASSPVNIPATFTVTSTITVTVSPLGPINFNQAQGGPAPAAQQLTLTSSAAGATFTASIPNTPNCSWLQIQPTSGPASGVINLIPLTNTLSQNTYACPITLAFQNSATSPVIVTANLIVGPPQTVTVSSTLLTFAYQQGGTLPVSQKLSVTSTGGPVTFSVATTSSGWLSVDATSGTTPKDINVSVNPTNVAAGTQVTGTITITAPGVLATPLVVTVTLTVSPPPIPLPTIIFNAASNAPGPIAPGELITIKGTQLGPAKFAIFTINAQGGVDSILAGVQVFFDGTPGTPTYVSATQINVIVPYEIAGRVTTNLVVAYQGGQSAPIQQSVTTVAPGIYTFAGSGLGQAAVLNLTLASAGTYNGPPNGVTLPDGTLLKTTPATGGSIIGVYGTGFGQTNPRGTTGSVNPTPPPLMPLVGWTPTSSTVTATIGGQQATVLFAGAAPTLVTGTAYFNIQVPTNVSGNSLDIVITVNGVSTPLGPKVAVQ